MRMLELNQTEVWYVNWIADVEMKDEDGYFTGELEAKYSEPIPIRLHLYPASGEVLEASFGMSTKLDYVTSTNIKLDENTLMFLSKPSGNFDTTYDFKVDRILASLNHYQYGLKGRR